MEKRYEGIAHTIIETDDIEHLSQNACIELQCGDKVVFENKGYDVITKDDDTLCFAFTDHSSVIEVSYKLGDSGWEYLKTETTNLGELPTNLVKTYAVGENDELTDELYAQINLGDMLIFWNTSFMVERKEIGSQGKIIFADSCNLDIASPWLSQATMNWKVGEKAQYYLKEDTYGNGGLNEDVCFYQIHYKNAGTNLYLCEVQGITTGTPRGIFNTMQNSVIQLAQALSIPINEITNLATLNTAVNTIYSTLVGAEQKTLALTLVSALALFDISAKITGEDFVGAFETLQGYILNMTYQVLLPWLFHYNGSTGLAEQTTLAGLLQSVSLEDRPIDEIIIDIPNLVIE